MASCAYLGDAVSLYATGAQTTLEGKVQRCQFEIAKSTNNSNVRPPRRMTLDNSVGILTEMPLCYREHVAGPALQAGRRGRAQQGHGFQTARSPRGLPQGGPLKCSCNI